MEHDVFISYASEDQAAADAICVALEQAGYTTWIAHRDNNPGTPYGANIIAALRACRALVLVYSEKASQSTFVLSEVENAKHFNKPMIPIRIQNIELSDELRLYISRIHWLDAFAPPLAKHLDKLVLATGKILGPGAKKVEPTTDTRQPQRPADARTSGHSPPPRSSSKEPATSGSAAGPKKAFEGISIFEPEDSGLLDLSVRDSDHLGHDLFAAVEENTAGSGPFGMQMPRAPKPPPRTVSKRGLRIVFRVFLAVSVIGLFVILFGIFGLRTSIGHWTDEGAGMTSAGIALLLAGLFMTIGSYRAGKMK